VSRCPSKEMQDSLWPSIGFKSAVSHTVGLDEFGHYSSNFASISPKQQHVDKVGKVLLQVGGNKITSQVPARLHLGDVRQRPSLGV
jgi:hypothetical protein